MRPRDLNTMRAGSRACGRSRPGILRSLGGAVMDPFARKLQGGMKSLPRVGLEQIIGRPHLKRAHRILSVRRGDDDMGHRNILVPGEFRHDIEPIFRGHADIKKQQVRLLGLHLRHDFGGRGRLPNDLDIRFLPEQNPEFLPGESFIVCNNRLNDHWTSVLGERRA